MNKKIVLPALAGMAAMAFSSASPSESSKTLRVVIIRHGEKPEKGDNLSCQGMNRALQLPNVLRQKFGVPDFTYVPALTCGTLTDHARMFQTVTPFAIKHNLTINSAFDESDYKNIVADVLQKTGTVLLVWEHKAIPHIAHHLGVKEPLSWEDTDFDSIWIIDFSNGKASLTRDQEGIIPDCPF
jgi:hypothetical protein